jgi:hypothetical protein
MGNQSASLIDQLEDAPARRVNVASFHLELARSTDRGKYGFVGAGIVSIVFRDTRAKGILPKF